MIVFRSLKFLNSSIIRTKIFYYFFLNVNNHIVGKNLKGFLYLNNWIISIMIHNMWMSWICLVFIFTTRLTFITF